MKPQVDWKRAFVDTEKEWARILPLFKQFVLDHPEWGCEGAPSNYPPQVTFSFYLKGELLRESRLTTPNPTRASVLKDEEMVVPAEFVAKVAGTMRTRRVLDEDQGFLNYQLRLDYNAYPVQSPTPV